MGKKINFSRASDRFYTLATALAATFIVPLFILSNNADEFERLDLLVTMAFLVVPFAALSSVLMAIGWIAARSGVVIAFQLAIRFLFFFVCLTGFALPLTLEAGQVEVQRIPLNVVNLLIALATAGGLLYLSLQRARKPLLLGFAVFLCLTTAISAVSAYSHFAAGRVEGAPAIYSLSKTRNIIVLSFDGLPLAASLELTRERPALGRAFKDFVFFENAISGHPATFASIISEMSGDVDIKTKFRDQKKMSAELDGRQLITNYLNARGYKVSTYGMYGRFLDAPERAFQLGSLHDSHTLSDTAEDTEQLLRYASARTISPYLVFNAGFTQPLIEFLGLDKYDDELKRKMKNHHGELWDKRDLKSLQDFEAYLANLRVSDDSAPVAHFTHFLHTHFPIDLDRDCAYRSNDKYWYKAHQTRAGAKDETECALSQMAQLIKKLKQLGVYDKSLIVLKSDHGQPVRYNDPTKLESFTVRGHKNWGFARYEPLLAIKDFDKSSTAPTYDDRPAILSDMAATLCTAATSSQDCARFPGYDLLGPSSAIPEDATYYVNVVENAQSTFKLDGTEVKTFKRSKDFLAAINEWQTSELVTTGVPCGASIDLSAGTAYNNGKTDNSRWVIWYDGDTAYLKFRDSGCGDRSLTVRLKMRNSGRDATAKFEVRVNGALIQSDAEIGPANTIDLTIALSGAAGDELTTLSISPPNADSVEGYDFLAAAFDGGTFGLVRKSD